ncbi:MAG: fatty acid desaturase [Candidatus Omnitrophica bacterium]|nr:fatty acid desaturase [Candidatus Omnitrophota bacterium]
MLKQSIPEELLKREAWKYYVAIFAWLIYLFLLPWAWSCSMALGFVLMVFPGVYLFTGMGFLMHECWHRYVPNVPNKLFFQIFSWLLLTDPQVYRLLHGSHHAEVNSWEDLEFHPFGRIKIRGLRILLNIFELIVGIAVLVIVQTFVMMNSARFRNRFKVSSLLIAIFMWTAYLVLIGLAAQRAFLVPVSGIVIPYVLTFWIGSLVLHHSQLIEHGNLFVSGDWNERNIKTRNLDPRGWAEKLFIFLPMGIRRNTFFIMCCLQFIPVLFPEGSLYRRMQY